MKAFAREVMLLEHSAFSYRISNKLAIEVMETDRKTEINTKKLKEKGL